MSVVFSEIPRHSLVSPLPTLVTHRCRVHPFCGVRNNIQFVHYDLPYPPLFCRHFVLLRPYIAHISLETSRVAALLAFLPRGVDLQKLIHLYHKQKAREKDALPEAIADAKQRARRYRAS